MLNETFSVIFKHRDMLKLKVNVVHTIKEVVKSEKGALCCSSSMYSGAQNDPYDQLFFTAVLGDVLTLDKNNS